MEFRYLAVVDLLQSGYPVVKPGDDLFQVRLSTSQLELFLAVLEFAVDKRNHGPADEEGTNQDGRCTPSESTCEQNSSYPEAGRDFPTNMHVFPPVLVSYDSETALFHVVGALSRRFRSRPHFQRCRRTRRNGIFSVHFALPWRSGPARTVLDDGADLAPRSHCWNERRLAPHHIDDVAHVYEEMMSNSELAGIAQALVAPGKGILAADESSGTIEKRFTSIGVESTEERRRDYREMLFSTEGASDFISGVILFDETLRQKAQGGTRLADMLSSQGIVPGIKVDKGAKALAGCPGEKITEGLDGLRERLAEYSSLGAKFTKWRAVIAIGDAMPSFTCVKTNAHALARYAALSQEAGLVPIVEPEVLMDGSHTIERCEDVTSWALKIVFSELFDQGVSYEGMLLKPNMVIAGKDAPSASVDEVARATVRCLTRHVPASVPGIVFLSGGQSQEEATAHLDAMNKIGPHPWQLSFSYGRALQASALEAWAGSRDNFEAGRSAFLHRARCNGAARFGKYDPEMEKAAVA